MITWDHLSFPSDTDTGLHGGIAADPACAHLYAGYVAGAGRHRLNVGTLPLSAGAATAPFSWSADSPLLLPEVSANASVQALAVHPTKPVLFVGWSQSPTPTTDQVVSWCDLTNGVPGSPTAIATGLGGHACHAIAFHPTLPVVYLSGGGGSQGVARQPLDPTTGHPTGAPVFFSFGSQGKLALHINASGTRLYAGTFPDTVDVYDLDPTTGAILAGHAFQTPSLLDTGGTDFLARFQVGPAAIYLRRNTGSGPFLSMWPLDGSGYPTGALQDRTDIVLAENQWAKGGIQSRCLWAGTGASAGKLWVAEKWTITDDYTSASVWRGQTINRYLLNGNGTLQASPAVEAQVWGSNCCRLWAHPNGTVALAKGVLSVSAGAPGNLVSGMQVRFTVTAATGGPSPQFPRTFQLYLRFPGTGPTTNIPVTALNTPSAWFSLDAWLKDSQAPGRYNLFVLKWVGGVLFTGLTVTIEVADKNTSVLVTLSRTVEGTELVFCVPGYAYGPASIRTSEITTWAQATTAYRAVADAVALPPESKPQRYPISVAQFYIPEISASEMSDMLQLINDLGCNCGLPQVIPSASQTLGAGNLDALATAAGVKFFTFSFYDPVDPPGEYFHYLPDIQNATALDAWMLAHAVNAGQTATDRLARTWPELGISDEPNALQPDHITEVRGNGTYLGFFQAWVQSYFSPLGYTPASFVPGAVSWTDAGLRPILDAELAAANTPANRLLFFATHRFFPWSFAEQYRLTNASIDRVSGATIKKCVNWNNYVANLYTPPGPGGNPKGVTSPGWFDVGRLGSHHPKTESWITSNAAELWFLWLDVMRVVGLMSPLGFSPAAFLIGTPLTGIAGSGKAFMLACLAAGCKYVDWYSLGPDPIFAESWSEQPNVFAEIAGANALVAGVEDHLFDAVPPYGNVAVLSYAVGRIWDPDNAPRLFHDESLFFTSLLCHARGPAGEKWSPDLIDEDEIRRGALSRYRALVITSPNIAQDVQALIAAWTLAGGVLLGTSGAGVADEANTPTETLTSVFGLASGRTADRTATISAASYDTQAAVDTAVIGSDPNYGTAGATLRVMGGKSPLSLAGATAKATFATGGGVAIAEHASGLGRAVSFGFWPGMAHWCSPARNVSPLTWNGNQFYPRGWDANVQRAGVGGLIAGAVPVTYLLDRADITVSLQRSVHGISAVLQNWAGAPQTNVVLSVPLAADARVPRAARSQVSGSLPLSAVGTTAQVTLPSLIEGDVLLLQFDPARNPATTSGGMGVCSTSSDWSAARTS